MKFKKIRNKLLQTYYKPNSNFNKHKKSNFLKDINNYLEKLLNKK